MIKVTHSFASILKTFSFLQCPVTDSYPKVQKPYVAVVADQEKKIPDLLMGKNREDPMTAPKMWQQSSNEGEYGMGNQFRLPTYI